MSPRRRATSEPHQPPAARPATLRRAPLLVALGALLLTNVGLFPATALAQHNPQGYRLDLWANFSEQLYHKTSDDNGSTWSYWSSVPTNARGDCSSAPQTPIYFYENPAVISDQPGRLWLVSKNTYGYLLYNVYTSGNGWRGWCMVPGTPGGAALIGSPTLTSWGPGRVDLCTHAYNAQGGIELRHTWAPNGSWNGTWETLGSGLMEGSSTAVAWGGGSHRIDVFARTGQTLYHKKYDGRWSAWESLGGDITSSPSVASPIPGRLDVVARWSNGLLAHIYFADNSWWGWETLDGNFPNVPNEQGTPVSPAFVSGALNSLDVFVLGDNQTWYQKSFNPYYGWSAYKPQGNLGLDVAFTYWNP